MAIERFEDIQSWQLAKELCIKLYAKFRDSKDYGFKDQILRAAVSIMNNIAEGFERHTKNEFIQFLFIARGSAGEVRSMLYLALELNFITESEFQEFKQECIHISKLIYKLIQSLK